MIRFLKKIFGSAHDRLLNRYKKIVKEVNHQQESLKNLSDEQLQHKTAQFRERFKQGESLDALLPEAYAVVKEACFRFSGTEVHVSGYDQKWDMVPYDVQVLGAIAMHYGTIAEMQTGEGKTLTAVMPLYLNALSQKPVHLVTVNDYLAERDCAWVGSILRWLGMTTGVLTNATMPYHRKEIYACDVVYGTASEFGFDYLRDNSSAMSKEEQVQRGYFYAIIDEVDSILIDEARTPLIISGPVPDSRQMYDELKEGVYELVRHQRELCSKLASEAKKTLEEKNLDKTKEQEAYRKLWLVGKGTPRNKILKKLKEDPDVRSSIDKWDLYYHSDQNKVEKQEYLAELYLVVDERSNEYELTDKGIGGWQTYTGGIGTAEDFVMIDISDEYIKIDENSKLSEEEKVAKKLEVREEDAKRKERAHNLRQLLRAHLLMEKDVDYINQDGKVVIIDENTGRPQPGRRFSDGLHQAIEAKEGLKVQKETQTYATITLQNYFRMYDKLAGMTGTASTEANELKEIYKIDVLEIPPHKPCQRNDANDEIYMTEREKYNAILAAVREVHEKGRPILIGTESVEVSEKLSRIFRQNNLPHTVLNAKQNEKEAEIISQAGKKSAITIATNMAGRGTDIKLDPEVAQLGGLHVIGTARHTSRRIDRQLRGRSGRQGDPGSSIFYISFEDTLLRLFASPRITAILQRFRPPEGEAISANMITKSVERAQQQLEQKNYMIRKHTLEYDDVMNKQRQAIYAFRNEVLGCQDIEALCNELILAVCQYGADQFLMSKVDDEKWGINGYRGWLMSNFPVSFDQNEFEDERLELEEIESKAAQKISKTLEQKLKSENSKIPEYLIEKDRPVKAAQDAVRSLMIRKNDRMWQQHLLQMDHLRSDVVLRAVGQRDPLMEFKHEAFALFEELSKDLKTEIAISLFRFEIAISPPASFQNFMQQSQLHLETARSLSNDLSPENEMAEMAEIDGEKSSDQDLGDSNHQNRVGRNENCPCGSGKKYKKCCYTSAV